LCQQRKSRRACPALGRDICPVCCGTKRLTEIACPADCAYLTTAREHPAAAVRRRHERDLALLVRMMRDFGERQSQLFFAATTIVARHAPANALESLVDADVIDAAQAMAATFETASRGVIYEQRPSSRPAERLVAALKPLFAEGARQGGSAFDRDAAVVLRRIAESVREAAADGPDAGQPAIPKPRAYLDWLARMAPTWNPRNEGERASPLIVP
jgi:hypothetical protein